MTEYALLPVRHVAEYTYCPRLFFFMEVEGVFLPSVDTEKGKNVHIRVDKPSQTVQSTNGSEEFDGARPRTVRSLSLSSERLGVTGTIDLVEIRDRTAVPIEYRKGRPKRGELKVTSADPEGEIDAITNHFEPWPVDRVQMGLQALLLKDNGYEVTKAVIYYAATKKKLELIVEADLEAEAHAILAAAQSCTNGDRPPPLLHDPRCVGCSLQPHCLPDEINHQRAEEADEEMIPRKVWPPHEDGLEVVVQTNGATVRITGSELKVADQNGKLMRGVPLANVESVSLLGAVQISTQALHALADRRIPIAFLSSAGRLVALVDPLDSASAHVRRAQVREFDKPSRCLELTTALVSAKISNQRTLLMRNHGQLPKEVTLALSSEMEMAAKAENIDVARGHEGQAAAIYFRHFAGMFRGPAADEFAQHGRKRRPPPDPINSCLSMAYTMLAHDCVAAIRLARLEPSIAAFHVSRPGRPALALDLMEPFRPLIADSVTISAFNRGELDMGHFRRTSAGCVLTDAGRKAFFNAYGRRMNTEVTHPVFEYRLTYRRMLVLHARMIAAWLLGEVPKLAFLTTR